MQIQLVIWIEREKTMDNLEQLVNNVVKKTHKKKISEFFTQKSTQNEIWWCQKYWWVLIFFYKLKTFLSFALNIFHCILIYNNKRNILSICVQFSTLEERDTTTKFNWKNTFKEKKSISFLFFVSFQKMNADLFWKLTFKRYCY